MRRRRVYVTRGFWTGLPRSTTTVYEVEPSDPAFWLVFRWYDWILLVGALVMASFINPNGSFMGIVATITAAWYFAAFPLLVVWPRLRRRGRWCIENGHSPHRDPSGDQICAWCRARLDNDSPAGARGDGNPSTTPRGKGQAAHSDRR